MISKQDIKYIRSLHRKKYRETYRQFIIEGEKMIEEALLYAPESLVHVYGIEKKWELPKTTNFSIIDQKELKKISTLKHPQSALAICKYLSFSAVPSQLTIALDTIQDPGNMGTILRMAAWYGVAKIAASMETVDCYNPKVVQASMGAIFNVEVEYVDLGNYLKNSEIPIYGAVLEGKNIYHETFSKRGILLMGNEGNGVGKDLLPTITHPLTIPKRGKGESLNVAMATGIFLSEFFRDSLR